jgi:hypothetical protein
MGVPRSQVLLRWSSGPGGNQTSPTWTSPAGYVTLVKSINAIAGAAGDFEVGVRPAGGAFQMSFVVQNIALGVPLRWDGWLVLNPDDQLYVFTAAGSLDVWISGAVLAGPNQFPPA